MLFHGEAAATIVVAVLLALAGVAITLRPPKDKRVAHWASAFCWVAAAELGLGLLLSARWMFTVAVPVGAVALLVYAIWLWRDGRDEDGSPESADSPPPTPRHRTGINIAGGSYTGDTLRIRNQDTGMQSKDADIEIEDADIE